MRKQQPGMSQTQYAKSRGLNQSWVGELQRRGVLVLLPNGRIDPGPSDQARARLIVPRMRRTTSNVSRDSFFQARAIREGYSAKLAKLEYERQSGKLVDGDVVLEKVTAAFANVRVRMRGLAMSLAPVVTAQSSVAVTEKLLSAAIDSALLGLSDDVLQRPDASQETGGPQPSPDA